MSPGDYLHFAYSAIHGYRLRTALMLLAMAIGVAAVVILTALGEGARGYVTGQFSSLGTNLVIVLPGRNETTGGAPPMTGETPRDLTLDDAEAVSRHHQVRRIAPIVVGSASISYRNREREAIVMGSTAAMLQVRHLEMAQGRFLPELDFERSAPLCVVGTTVKEELFGNEAALGQWLRVGDRRCRIIGLLKASGVSLGVDTDELVIIPVATAQQMFNSASLFRLLVEAKSREVLPQVEEHVKSTIRERHEGEEDVTVITQDALLSTFDRILSALTMALGGIASISLVVAGVLIMNVMLVAVTQRTTEIGLLKAIGATPGQIQRLFLAEAALLSLFGGLIGLALGQAGSSLIARLYPILPVAAPTWAVIAALSVALIAGLLFGSLPARRAARLDPVQALSRR